MTLLEFKHSLEKSEPPHEISNTLLALWHDGKGDWDLAHTLAQETETLEGSWIHAYLHRKEGDESNARYWYTRAGKKPPKISLREEWEDIVSTLL